MSLIKDARPLEELIEFINRNCVDPSYDPNALESMPDEETHDKLGTTTESEEL